MKKQWADMTWQEKREERFQRWLNPGVKFISAEAGKLYKERVNRFIKAIKLEEPDRVPVMIPAEYFRPFTPAAILKRSCMTTMN